MRPRAALGVVLAVALSACAHAPRWDGPVRPHFDGTHFVPAENFDKSLKDLWRYYWEKEPSAWVRDMSLPPGPAPVTRVGPGELRVTFVNHATVLIQVDGMNLLTDPIWSYRAGPLSWLGSARFRPPGIAFADLPPIDAVLISHNHYDHLDLPTLRRLQAHSDPMLLVPAGDAIWLRQAGFARVQELDWDQSVVLPNGCRVHAVESRHWSQRQFLPSDRNLSLWVSWVVETAQGPVYFAGDTGYGPHFTQTQEQFGPMRLALLPIGAYKPRWLTAYQHVDPAQAVQAHQDLQARVSLGIHWGSFELSAEAPDEPARDLAQARAQAGLAEQAFFVPRHGIATIWDPVPADLALQRCLPSTLAAGTES